jgi:hypothetical protein
MPSIAVSKHIPPFVQRDFGKRLKADGQHENRGKDHAQRTELVWIKPHKAFFIRMKELPQISASKIRKNHLSCLGLMAVF